MDGVELTGLHAVAAAQTSIGTLEGARGDPAHGQATLQTHIVVAGLVVATAGAHHLGDLPGADFDLHAHDLTDLIGHVCATGGAGVHRGLTGHDGRGVAATARVAAAAAVGAGEAFRNGLFSRILLHGEDLSGHSQNGAEHNTQYTQYNRG